MMILARNNRTDIKGYKDVATEEAKIRSKRKGKPSAGSRTPISSENAPGLLEQQCELDNDGDLSSDDEALEDVTGWKLLHADVIRSPLIGHLLAPMVGSGPQ